MPRIVPIQQQEVHTEARRVRDHRASVAWPRGILLEKPFSFNVGQEGQIPTAKNFVPDS